MLHPRKRIVYNCSIEYYSKYNNLNVAITRYRFMTGYKAKLSRSQLRHRNLVKLNGWCHKKNELILIYKYKLTWHPKMYEPHLPPKERVQGTRLTRCYGLEVQRPVILPLSRVGSVRCSVKPASRYTLLSKTHKTGAFAQVSWVNSQLGAGRPAWCNHQTNLLSLSHVPSPYCPHMGHKPALLSSAN
ncbi:hypothetical protein KIW84_071671 [Lathyrus oleraceus]|uniref:Uncharacterized protein n=1 Tax=Pisum sativum TaxID=3888 RepID=A0A9D4VJC2_PEA|nr:hypothetical protein KIW84_071671 [Pisum sativum]